MPKKYKQKSLLTKPSSSASSTLSLSRPTTVQNESPKRTVNELLRESRRSDGNEAVQHVQTLSSLPPPLRSVLDMPTPASPPPRNGFRGPRRFRRIPGPPPPKSWLSHSIHAPSEVRDLVWSERHERSRIQKQFSSLPGENFPSQQSLVHILLRAMAMNWIWHAEYDHEYLAELPVRMKQMLLSYIAIYGDIQGTNPLKLLFPTDLPQDELDDVRRLDLGNAIGTWSTLRKIGKELETNQQQNTSKLRTAEDSTREGVPSTWEEDDTDLYNIPPATIAVKGLRFGNLKHLSLAVSPGTNRSTASWASLLSIAVKLSTITSLSLAYWPQPTYTPNASNGRVKIGGSGPVPASVYGGSNYYTAFDNDWREAAGILRSLSRSLYCLTWLDLTGCGEWLSALTWKPSETEDPTTDAIGPDWNGSWRSLESIILAVGWSPGPLPSETLPEPTASDRNDDTDRVNSVLDSMSSRTTELLSQLSTTRLNSVPVQRKAIVESWNVEHERQKYYHRKEVEKHAEIIDRAKVVAHDLRLIRKEHGGKWINVEFGSEEI